MSCKICNKDDLFTEVTGELACSICTLAFGLPTPTFQSQIDRIRRELGLQEGSFLRYDAHRAAARILGRE